MNQIEEAYHKILQPSDDLITDMSNLEGDIIILGAGGKMGPALAKLARQTVDKAGIARKITAVSRFSELGLEDELNQAGVETISADLMDENQLQKLPDAQNILYMAGTKFGTTGNEPYTWAMNSYLPGRVAQKYKNSRIVVFSTGNVYPLTSVNQGGAAEDHITEPVGEYAQSCLGRERIFQYYSEKNNTPILIYRLNYASDVSYGVLLDIAKAVDKEVPIDLSMGNVNVIWQGDANEMALRAFHHCEVPAKILNITGPETASVKWIAREFGKLFNKTPQFINEEKPTALLSNAAESFQLFGYPKVPLKKMMELMKSWVIYGGKTLDKPTHFQERKGQF